MNSEFTSDRVSSGAEFIEMEDRPATSGLPGKPTPDEEEKAREREEKEGKEIVVIGYDRPKVIQWDDLQQELARLLSLSAEIKRVKEMKEDLSQRIESIIEAEKGSLLQQNELEKSRQRMDAKRHIMGDLLFRSKRAAEDARTKREELCYEIRWLLVASKTLSVARQQLQEDKKFVAGEKGHGHLKNLSSMLRSRQRHMVTQVSMIYPVRSSTSQNLHENPIRHPKDTKSGNHSRISSTNVLESAHISLSILGVQPVTPQLKRMSFFGDKKEAQKSATALGYVAHVVLCIATYLGVPLRYSIYLGGSRSYIHDFTPSVELAPSDLASNSMTGAVSQPAKFPLFLEAQDTTKAAYAIFLLNKDLEQILNFIGGQSLGPSPKHILANLKQRTESQQRKDGLVAKSRLMGSDDHHHNLHHHHHNRGGIIGGDDSITNTKQMMMHLKGSKLGEGVPIILVPSASQTLITIYNVREFLEDGIYVPMEKKMSEMKAAGLSKPDVITVQKKLSRDRMVVAYEVRDKPTALKKEDWDRVVSVFVLGKEWQFKDWPFRDHAEIFSKIAGFFVRFEDDSVESAKTVKKWNVKIISISKNKRHQDRAAALQVWERIDALMRSRSGA